MPKSTNELLVELQGAASGCRFGLA